MSDAFPFETDAEYLDVLWAMLATRARRLTVARELRRAEQDDTSVWPMRGRRRRDQNGDDEPTERLAMLTAREERQVGEIEARLRATRSAPGVRRLGLDRLAMAHDLGEQERIVLAMATCHALSEELAEFICGDLGVGFSGSASVEFYMRLLEADGAADRVRARRIFEANAPLLKGGLIAIDWHRNDSPLPEDLLWSRVRITQPAFNAIVGAGAPDLVLVEENR